MHSPAKIKTKSDLTRKNIMDQQLFLVYDNCYNPSNFMIATPGQTKAIIENYVQRQRMPLASLIAATATTAIQQND